MQIDEKNPSFSNPLARSSSPYLRQHSKNPVYWYPWGEEALKRARDENKPILLSIGYSTCYWCHVMEREVFENLSIASLMNRDFINIKIDREEHPQIDEIYMTARQLMTHEGGWPNTVFLTPDLKPFYAGGTYSAREAYGKPAFPRLLEWLNNAWQTEREEVLRIAEDTTQLMKNFLTPRTGELLDDYSEVVAEARAALEKHHDAQSGGFFKAPKFPQENYLQFLLTHYEITRDQNSLDMAVFSLGKMAAGGINDQVGCGFHRYAVDKDWFVPHFEKMLYTQGLLARCYTDAARITGNPYLASIARSICDFVSGVLTHPRGAFYAAIDAETDEVEGAYYAWKTEEMEKILTKDEIAFFIHHYGLANIPHFPGHKHPEGEVIIARMPLYEAALAQNRPYSEIAGLAGGIMNKLLAVRNNRKAPHLDEKIIVSWNGLMIDAMANAGRQFSYTPYIERAARAAEYILKHGLNAQGHLARCVTHGTAEHLATLEDYAYFIRGLLTLHQAGGDTQMLAAATHLMQQAESLFGDADAPGFFTTQESDAMIIRIKNGDDSSLPNANAVMAQNYLTIAALTHDAQCIRKAHDMLDIFLSGSGKMWIEYTGMLRLAMRAQGVLKHVAVDSAKLQAPEIVCDEDGNCTPVVK